MRVIKNNTLEFETLLESLQLSKKSPTPKSDLRLVKSNNPVPSGNMLEKYAHIFQNITALESQLNEVKDVKSLTQHLFTSVRRVLTVKEANIFYFDESHSLLLPVTKSASDQAILHINRTLKEGILDWIFENRKPTLIPNASTMTAKGSQLNYLIFPIYEAKKQKGVFSIATPVQKFDPESIDGLVLEILLGMVIPRLDYLKQKDEVNSLYQELQTYQSKLSNDFKLSAIGELTSGIVEDIISPLQVIMSSTEILEKDLGDTAGDNLDTIKSQVKKIETVINRLVKFASVNNDKLKIYPCDVNKILNDFYDVVVSSLKNDGYECILELEENLPPILSNPNHINQLLTNVFSILKAAFGKSGGIFVQTKYINEHIHIRFISTDHIENFNKPENKASQDLSMKIIKNIMKKHEGEFTTESDSSYGSLLVLNFPLKRKLR